MRWFHWPVELFEGTDNPRNAEMIVMERRADGYGFCLSERSLAVIGLWMPPGASMPELLPGQREALRATLGESAEFCEFASATAALRAQQRKHSAAAHVANSQDMTPAQRKSNSRADSCSGARTAQKDGDDPASDSDATSASSAGRDAEEEEEDAGAVERHRRSFLSKPRRPTLSMLHGAGAQSSPATIGCARRSFSEGSARSSRAAAGLLTPGIEHSAELASGRSSTDLPWQMSPRSTSWPQATGDASRAGVLVRRLSSPTT